MSIRFKVILPYLLLTLLVAVTGAYVVTRLVSNSLSERLNNQLLEAGRVISDTVARQELKHIEVGRAVAYTTGVPEAIQAGDKATLAILVRPLAAGLAAENLILVDTKGEELLHIIIQADATLQDISAPTGLGSLPMVQDLLNSSDPKTPPRRGFVANPADNRYYYYTAMPVTLDNRIVGVVIIGKSIETLLPYLKSVSLADIVLYDDSGQAIATTIGQNESGFLQSVSVPPQDFDQLLHSDKIIEGNNLYAGGRWYSLARGPLLVSSDRIGVYGVVLPSDFVIQPGSASRNTTVLIFTVAMLAVVFIGFIVSRLIINPLFSLVRTSQAITKGDLTKRSGIRSKDEIGTLASSFDEMTSRLQERTAELERTYHTLEQMDRTKSSFIDVSAHELRSPLTSVKGYAQLIDMKTKSDPELQNLAKGLNEGVERMTDIVNNMLDVTRIDSNALKLVPTQVQISTVVMRVVKFFQKGLEERRLTLQTAGLDELPTIFIDPDLMYKVFYHLVMNAIKYTPDGGTITVHGRVIRGNLQTPEMEIVIEDTGIGVSPEHHEVIFEKFFQTGEVLFHSSGKTKFKGGGPGLGLAIARGIVNAHHGRIWVESPGYDEAKCPGSKFIIRLPLTGVGLG